jgi:hypothetical protein
MQRISKKRSGYKAPWPLAEALKWRLRHGGTLEEANRELATLHGNGVVEMVGLIAESHPERNEEPQWYRLFVDPATSYPPGTPLLAVIPTGALSELYPVLDNEGQPTSALENTEYLSLAWRGVELEDLFTAKRAWLPLIKATTLPMPGAPASPPAQVDGPRSTLRAAALERVFIEWMNSERAAHGRYPPRDKSPKFGEDRKTWDQWARKNGITRNVVQGWVNKNQLSEPRGAPSRNLAG